MMLMKKDSKTGSSNNDNFSISKRMKKNLGLVTTSNSLEERQQRGMEIFECGYDI